jgi:glutathione S-transferase
MKTIVCITTKAVWENSKQENKYTQSTITSTLDEVGYIHATSPDQTMGIVQRFIDQKDVILLLIDVSKVTSPIKFEAAPSGRPGLFPHIYGPVNIDSVYEAVELARTKDQEFIEPAQLSQVQ